jgi:hypothetical protein
MAAFEPRPDAAPPEPRPAHLRRLRVRLARGAVTTLHVATYRAQETDLRVLRVHPRTSLEAWCGSHGHPEAMVGGFYVRPGGRPLGELRTRGVARAHVAFDAPWGADRACVHSLDGAVRIAPRTAFGATPPGDLLQAGPLLVRDGARVVTDGVDPEGFSAGARQFDSDISDGRHPRAALAIAGEHLLAVVCDGRAARDAGLTLGELADALVALGATAALNLDGGGSASLVSGGRLRNEPRASYGVPIPGGRAISTALVFASRA